MAQDGLGGNQMIPQNKEHVSRALQPHHNDSEKQIQLHAFLQLDYITDANQAPTIYAPTPFTNLIP